MLFGQGTLFGSTKLRWMFKGYNVIKGYKRQGFLGHLNVNCMCFFSHYFQCFRVWVAEFLSYSIVNRLHQFHPVQDIPNFPSTAVVKMSSSLLMTCTKSTCQAVYGLKLLHPFKLNMQLLTPGNMEKTLMVFLPNSEPPMLTGLQASGVQLGVPGQGLGKKSIGRLELLFPNRTSFYEWVD